MPVNAVRLAAANCFYGQGRSACDDFDEVVGAGEDTVPVILCDVGQVLDENGVWP